MIEAEFNFKIVWLNDHALSLNSNNFFSFGLKKKKGDFCENFISQSKEKQTCNDNFPLFLIMKIEASWYSMFYSVKKKRERKEEKEKERT